MKPIDRRRFVAALSAPAIVRAAPATGIRIDEIQHSYEDYRYRTPYKFGGREVDRVTLLNVECRVKSRDGKTARGFTSSCRSTRRVPCRRRVTR